MARPDRFFLPGQPQHVIQRGNNRSAVFFEDGDYVFYLECLGEAAQKHGCDIHAYALMTNHVHLLMTPCGEASIPRTLQSLGRRYVRHVNIARNRTGTLWEGRYKAAVIDSEAYLLTCCRYIEENPVRAGLARNPGDYPWSSYQMHGGGKADPLITDHPMLLALGETPGERRKAYLQLFRRSIEPQDVDGLRAATNGGWVFGGANFKRRAALLTGKRVTPLPKGRPRKNRSEGDREE